MVFRWRVPCNYRWDKNHRKRPIVCHVLFDLGTFVSRPQSCFYIRIFQEPELDIDSIALNAWERGQFMNAEALLSAAIPTSKNTHHVHASRALVRARLGQWDAALVDAKGVCVTPLSQTWTLTPFRTKSIQIQRSFVGYIAQCVTLVGEGEQDAGIRVCDFHSEHPTLLLIKVYDSA